MNIFSKHEHFPNYKHFSNFEHFAFAMNIF
jgi:hypothetical protein